MNLISRHLASFAWRKALELVRADVVADPDCKGSKQLTISTVKPADPNLSSFRPSRVKKNDSIRAIGQR